VVGSGTMTADAAASLVLNGSVNQATLAFQNAALSAGAFQTKDAGGGHVLVSTASPG
jgi:hypothetical protein